MSNSNSSSKSNMDWPSLQLTVTLTAWAVISSLVGHFADIWANVILAAGLVVVLTWMLYRSIQKVPANEWVARIAKSKISAGPFYSNWYFRSWLVLTVQAASKALIFQDSGQLIFLTGLLLLMAAFFGLKATLFKGYI